MLRLYHTGISAAMLVHTGLVFAPIPVHSLPPLGWTCSHTGNPCCQLAQGAGPG